MKSIKFGFGVGVGFILLGLTLFIGLPMLFVAFTAIVALIDITIQLVSSIVTLDFSIDELIEPVDILVTCLYLLALLCVPLGYIYAAWKKRPRLAVWVTLILIGLLAVGFTGWIEL